MQELALDFDKRIPDIRVLKEELERYYPRLTEVEKQRKEERRRKRIRFEVPSKVFSNTDPERYIMVSIVRRMEMWIYVEEYRGDADQSGEDRDKNNEDKERSIGKENESMPVLFSVFMYECSLDDPKACMDAFREIIEDAEAAQVPMQAAHANFFERERKDSSFEKHRTIYVSVSPDFEMGGK